MTLCSKCGEQNPEGYRFCGFCAAPLAPTPAAEARKTVSIVFSDLVGSTSLGERLDSETLRDVLSLYFEAMRGVLERHGGVVEKFIGDAVMAVFGLPRVHEDDALRAVRAAHEMTATLTRLNDELERKYGVRLTNRTGVHTGEVVAGDPAGGQRLVTGDAVNTAARLEQAAPPGQVLIGHTTLRLVGDAVDVEPIAPLPLKGKSKPVSMYRLLAVRPGETVRRMGLPLVGRSEEIVTLWKRYEEAALSDASRLVTVVGSAGIGKSRLVYEFLQGVGSQVQVLRGRCLSYGEGITFWPLAEAVRQAAGIAEDDTGEQGLHKLARFMGDDDGHAAAPVAAAIGLSTEAFGVEEIFWGVRKLFEGLARRRRLIMVFEDIHWGEPTFLDLVAHVATMSRHAPMLLICTARPDLLEERPGWSSSSDRATTLVLEALPDRDSLRIVENMLGGPGIPADVREAVIRAAQGNPLFVEQTMLMLLEEGLLERDEQGRWGAASEIRTLAIPPTISALLASRLDRLPRGERADLERGSVVGLVFYRGAIEALSDPETRPEVPAHLESLQRRQLILPDDASFAMDQSFRFHHILIRDVAYGGMLKRTRAALHERFADWLEGVVGDRLTEYEEIVGHHLEQAYRLYGEVGWAQEDRRALGNRAGRRLAAAGLRAARDRRDHPSGINLLSRASELLDRDDPLLQEVLGAEAFCLFVMGRLTAAREAASEAEILASIRSDMSALWRARFMLLQILAATDPSAFAAEARRETDHWAPILEELDDHGGLARVWSVRGNLSFQAGRLEEAEADVRRTLDHARIAKDGRGVTTALGNLALLAHLGPMPTDEGAERCRAILADPEGNRFTEFHASSALGSILAMRGEFGKAQGSLDRALRIVQDMGDELKVADTNMSIGAAELLAGDLQAAEHALRMALEQLTEIGERELRPTVCAVLADVLVRAGRFNEAARFAIQSHEASAAEGYVSETLWRSVTARLRARTGKAKEAVALARQAVRIVAHTDNLDLQGEANFALAEVLALVGDREAAETALRDSLALFEKKGNLVRAGDVQKALAELPGG